jgi:hypothetical protein
VNLPASRSAMAVVVWGARRLIQCSCCCVADASMLEKLQASLRRGPYAGTAAPAEMELESA